jgi:hypothetical protein
LSGRVSDFIEKEDILIVARLTCEPKVRHTIYGCITFHLASSSTVSKFSTTSPSIPQARQLLNPCHTTRLKIANSLLLPLIFYLPLRVTVGGHAEVGKEDMEEKLLLIVFFVLLTKKETRIVGVHLPLS